MKSLPAFRICLLHVDLQKLHLATLNHEMAAFMFRQDQSVSFACKQALMRLIHKHWHGMGNSTPRCNTPTGEGVGGDDFDGEDDDGDQDRSNETPPEESNGTDAEGGQAGRQQDAEAPEVTHLHCICIYQQSPYFCFIKIGHIDQINVLLHYIRPLQKCLLNNQASHQEEYPL